MSPPRLESTDDPVNQGTGTNVASGEGHGIEAGQIVMPGAVHRAVDVGPGDEVRAIFDRLGDVTVRFGLEE